MILRSRDIPELKNLTEEHRQQIIAGAENAVFWKPASLLFYVAFTVIDLGIAGVLAWLLVPDYGALLWFMPIVVIALTTASSAAYRVVGVNSFLRPAIESLLETGLPREVERPVAPRSLQLTVFVFALFVIGLFGSVFLGAGR